MSVYINAGRLISAKNPTKRTACQLGQAVELPYFNAFPQPLLSLPELYTLIDQQIEQILTDTGWHKSELAKMPIFLGSTGYVIADCESRLAHNQPLPTEYSIAIIGDYLKARYQTQVFSIATSCTSAAQGIHYAYKMIQKGFYEKALVIGFEAFNRLTFEHFHAMHLLSSDLPYLPMIEPNGIVLGEGLACIALSNQPHSHFECELLAIESLTDNQNLTNTSEPLFRQLLEQILTQSGLSANQIQGVKLHAVGGNSDEMEHQVLKEYLPTSQWIIPKAFLGHTLGATGAMETAFLLDCLQQGKMPDLQKNPQNLPLAKSLPNGYYLNYFLGFGGSNVGWIMRWENTA